ncbi:hypothetical protein Pla110_21640 [Polystyrenella longa]|uniref:Uncharacterized protein n=1 Tax=Polystyrenella longa TaxID=2528007 RepID=A0A518CML2_9PLAN|nr:hypothetical protein [Polystyrenella longa]QDU80434.1 hypothetical protein Pla110_21640 [Polystyrenella longa]
MEYVKSFFAGATRHHYWILAVVVIILPIWAWQNMAAATTSIIDQRKNAIVEAENKVQNISGPNQNWIENAEKLNEVNEAQQQASIEKLFRSQQLDLTWPASVASIVEEKEFQYRQQFNDLEVRRHFAGTLGSGGKRLDDGYKKEIDKLVESLEPYDPFTKSGNIFLNPETVLQRYPNSDDWLSPSGAMPSDLQIWDSLEDLSLQASLVEAIRNINSSAISIGKAPIKQIQQIQLLGGSISDFRDPAGYEDVDINQSGGGGGDIDQRVLERIGASGKSNISKGAVARIRDEEITKANAKDDTPAKSVARTAVEGNLAGFDPSTQFGMPHLDPESDQFKQQEKQKTAADTSQEDDGRRGGGLSAEDRARLAALREATTQEAAPELDKVSIDTATFVPRKETRYIDIDDTKEFVTRGFYIEVTMDHRKLPELIGNLTNMKYPTVIARVQAVSRKHNQSELATRSQGSGSIRRSRDEDEENEEASPSPTGTSKAPGVATGSVETDILSNPYLADVAIAGYMAVFKLETMLDKLNTQEEVPADQEENQPGELNRALPATNRNGRD